MSTPSLPILRSTSTTDDYHLKEVLRKSKSKAAQRVVGNDIPVKIFESFGPSQLKVLDELDRYLKENNIDFIKCSSVGRLSKYYRPGQESPKFYMKVVRSSFGQKNPHHFNINEATDLFDKFSRTHAVNRLHCDFDKLSPKHKESITSLLNSSTEDIS